RGSLTDDPVVSNPCLTGIGSERYDAGGEGRSLTPDPEEEVMPLDMPVYLENMRKFLENRQKFPPEELVKYMGSWIAWSPDGTRIVAHTQQPEDLEELVRAAGEDPR